MENINICDKKEEIRKNSYLSKRGYVLKKEFIEKDEFDFLKKELRGRPLQDEKYNFNNIDTTFPIYIETKNKLYIPKMYGINRYGFPPKTLPNYDGIPWQNLDIEFNGNLYDRQIEPIQVVLNACKEHGGGILRAGTGSGKTIMSINILSQLKTKTIIIVNKIPLMKQWESEIRHFLPGINIGFIQGQKNVSVEGNDIVLAMLQSLARVNYPDSLFQDFGLLIVDEVHNTSSRVFSQVLAKICCKYTIGLSATPKRSDGCEYIFKYHLGDIVYQTNLKRSGLPPILNLLKIDSSEYKEISNTNRITGQTQIQFTSMLSELTVLEKRNRLIIQMIKHLVYNQNRKILVLSDRRDHLKFLKQLFEKDPTITFTYGLFLGQMKQIDLERSKSSKVILATFSAFGEGVSEKDLDTLILITPKKFVGHLKKSIKNDNGKLEQIVGRIFRKDHINLHPLIIDLQDNFSVYKTQSASRNVFYRQHFKNATFEYQYINLDDHNLEDINVECIIKKKTTAHFDDNTDHNTAQMITNCVIDD